jgi:hypothetical protein
MQIKFRNSYDRLKGFRVLVDTYFPVYNNQDGTFSVEEWQVNRLKEAGIEYEVIASTEESQN